MNTYKVQYILSNGHTRTWKMERATKEAAEEEVRTIAAEVAYAHGLQVDQVHVEFVAGPAVRIN